jgi:TetR/AcrR family transcriptional repressor of nem operon
MNRPKEFDRDGAVAALMEEIWVHGFETCSVNSMSQKLGITRSSFYNAFGSREKLFAEILEIYRESVPGKGMFEINDSRTVLGWVTEKLHEFCKFLEEDKSCRGCLAVSSIQEIVKKNDELEPILKEFFYQNTRHFEKIMSIAVERGELEDCDIRIKALSLQSMMMGLSEMSKIFRTKGELWSICQHSLKALSLYSEFEQTPVIELENQCKP